MKLNFLPITLKLKTVLISIFVVFFLAFVFIYIQRNYSNKYIGRVKGVYSDESSIEDESVFKKMIKPVFTDTKSVSIDSVGVKADTVPVGILKDGSLETPKDWLKAGWYSKGAKPGENGNLIIDGHYDDSVGGPAAFWQLKNVKLGDKVVVTDSYGRSFNYQISEYTLVGINDPNRLEVFEDDEKARITLITCGGVWIPGKATYDKRLVVFGELIR